jgi:hypothetical protein
VRKRRSFTVGKHETLALPATADAGDELTLPPSYAFVVQFRAEAAIERNRYIGRVEHVVSNRASSFSTLEELLEFFKRLLALARAESSANRE